MKRIAQREVQVWRQAIKAKWRSCCGGLNWNTRQRSARSGLASGNARHEFITAKMERMQQCQEQLGQLIGEREATVLVAQLLEAKPE